MRVPPSPSPRRPQAPAPGKVRIWVCLLLGIGTPCLGQGLPPDYHSFIGVARGTGEVTVSPLRGLRFNSASSSDVAFARTGGPLPDAYRITVNIRSIDTRRAGCAFAVFSPDLRFGGPNDAVNGTVKFGVVFHEWQDKRRIYAWYFDSAGDYHCWDGKGWSDNSWRPTGGRWQAGGNYVVALSKMLTSIELKVRDEDTVLVSTPPIATSLVRGAATPDYLAFGDLATDYVHGSLDVASVTIEESAMEPHLQADMTHATIRQAPEGRYAMYGGLTRLPNGEVFCLYKVGSVDEKGSPWTVRDETIVWTRSSDQGRSWPGDECVIYRDGTTRQEACCGKGHLSKDSVLTHAFYILNADYEERAQEQNWSRLNLAVSGDMGESWQVRPLDTPLPLTSSFGGIVPLADGTLLLNIYGAAEKGTFRHQAGVLRSGDDGKTWGDYSILGAAADPGGGPARLNETDIAQLPGGRLVSMSRTQYEGYPIYRGVSDDLGRTWSVEPSGLTGLCPCLVYTPDGPPEGTLVIAYHDRWGAHAAKGGVYLAFSHDGGASWGHAALVSGGAYPCMVPLADGTLLCSYYHTNAHLRGTYFSVPFPTGLRVSTGIPESVNTGLRVQWDPYTGKAATGYSYRVYRGTDADLAPGEASLIGVVTDQAHLDDTRAESGVYYFYRVAAYEGDRRVGVSWLAGGRAGRADEGDTMP